MYRTNTRRPTRRVLSVSLLASFLLHVLTVIVVYILTPEPYVRERFRPHRLPPSRAIERYRPRPAQPVAQGLLQQVRSLAGSQGPAAPDISASGPPVRPGEVQIPLPPEQPELTRGPFATAAETLDVSRLPDVTGTTALPTLDPIDFAAQGTARTVVLIDEETGKLKQAFVHLPAYEAGEWCAGGLFSPSRPLLMALELTRRGFRVPNEVPLQEAFQWHWLGRCCQTDYTRDQGIDPLHTQPWCPERRLLSYTEMRNYLVIVLRYIDVVSAQAAVRYLVEGGTMIARPGQLALLRGALIDTVGDRVRDVRIELGHPLFSAFYDITEYRDGNRGCGRGGGCAPVTPLNGVEVDGRLVLLTSPPFNAECPCPANQLFVNALAFALIQPSSMGGRFVQR